MIFTSVPRIENFKFKIDQRLRGPTRKYINKDHIHCNHFKEFNAIYCIEVRTVICRKEKPLSNGSFFLMHASINCRKLGRGFVESVEPGRKEKEWICCNLRIIFSLNFLNLLIPSLCFLLTYGVLNERSKCTNT